MIKNPRLVRLIEDLFGFNFKVDYIQGEKNILADYLSRHPNAGEEAPFYPRLMKPSLFTKSGHVTRVNGGEVVDLVLLRLAEMGLADLEYQSLIKCISEGRNPKDFPGENPIKEYGPYFNSLSIEDTAAAAG